MLKNWAWRCAHPKKKNIIICTISLQLLEKTFYSLFLPPNLDKIWSSWSSVKCWVETNRRKREDKVQWKKICVHWNSGISICLYQIKNVTAHKTCNPPHTCMLCQHWKKQRTQISALLTFFCSKLHLLFSLSALNNTNWR